MQHAHKISAIKRKGEHPGYNQQKGANNYQAEGSQRLGNNNLKKTKNWKGKGKKKAHFTERSNSPNPFTLVALAIAQPMIAIQPSRAPPNVLTIVSFKPSGTTYSTVLTQGGSA